jgi:hypothetical protein
MTKRPGRRLRRNQADHPSPKEHPLYRANKWKATSDWYRSFGGEENYRKEMAKRMARQHSVGSVVYSVERAIEAQFPTATEEEWNTLARRIVHEVIDPIQEENGAWRFYPITNADHHFGPREYELRARYAQSVPFGEEEQ